MIAGGEALEPAAYAQFRRADRVWRLQQTYLTNEMALRRLITKNAQASNTDRADPHKVLSALNEPPDGEPRVEKTYAKTTLPRQFRIDTPGLTAVYPVEYVRNALLEQHSSRSNRALWPYRNPLAGIVHNRMGPN